MNRKRGRRSTRRDMAELVAEIQEATKEWNALPLEERMRAGQKHWHSTPGPRREQLPSFPFSAWARFEPQDRRPVSGAFANWA
ncbi:MAG TPA: hypothetical protein VGP76_05845 [Planctomycetaceae bacterium]|jgi:hypothetical protein|nr:hypothetical protein [Planctomycetaceae bacterium]